MNNGLKDAWGKYFKIGAAVCGSVIKKKEADDILKKHFSTLTIENGMKFGRIHPEENKWNWEECDLIASYAKKNGLLMRGHTIVWHNQNPSWLFLDGGDTASKEVMYRRLEDHIEKLTDRYKNDIYSWDVVNEAIDVDHGDENGFRPGNWYKICGKEIYETAFKLMRQACPGAKLLYNDYNNESGAKMETTIKYIKSLLDAGIPIDGVGLQGHWYFNFPDEKTLRAALESYSSLGINIELTEVDISVYKWMEGREKKDFFTSRPQDRITEQGKRFLEIFNIISEYPAVKNITTWGIADSFTWLDNFPVPERKNWPLLFDENFNEKPVVGQLIEAGLNKK